MLVPPLTSRPTVDINLVRTAILTEYHVLCVRTWLLTGGHVRCGGMLRTVSLDLWPAPVLYP